MTPDARSAEGLYLLHFSPPYRHARHYLGYAADIPTRVHEHASSSRHVSPLVRAALEAGATLRLTRVWIGGDRTLESRLKRQGGLSRHCPDCRAGGDYHAGSNTLARRRRLSTDDPGRLEHRGKAAGVNGLTAPGSGDRS